jgi:phosphate transport system substrate-binding protein
MVNKAGRTIAPGTDSFRAAAANADWALRPGFGVILADQPGEESWPMTAATWILVHKHPEDSAATGQALVFFAWAYREGDTIAEALDYVPLPDTVVSDVEKMWAAEIKDSAGKPVFAMN